MQDEPDMIIYAVPCNKPIIIDENKVEEFLNMDNYEALNKSLERANKFDYIVTDNTKVGD